jgi:hypothetical protein
MEYFRVYKGEDGLSHFEDIDLEYAPVDIHPDATSLEATAPTDAARYVMAWFPVGWKRDFHPTPRRQIFILLEGEFGGQASDGEVRSMRPGDLMLMEDTEGKGHTAYVIGDKPVFGMMLHLE